MAQKRRKRKPALAPKYRFRRVILVLVILAVAGVAAWRFLPFGEETAPMDGVPEEGLSSEESPGSSTPPEPESSSEPSSEPEPEPDPEPTITTTDWNLLLVNSASPLPDDFEVELETVSDGYQVDKRIADNIRRMFMQAKEDGINLMICSAYRSVERQTTNFNAKVQELMGQGYSEEEADAITVSMIARPTTSEHHTGLAVDIVTPEYQLLDEGFAETPAFKWLNQNAYKYGFALRFPKDKESITKIIYEPWHYRYVGKEHALAMKETGYCLEEYLYVALKQQLREQSEAEAINEPIIDETSQSGT